MKRVRKISFANNEHLKIRVNSRPVLFGNWYTGNSDCYRNLVTTVIFLTNVFITDVPFNVRQQAAVANPMRSEMTRVSPKYPNKTKRYNTTQGR